MQQLQPGSTLQSGKYKILRVLGQGGFGITYLAENIMLDGKVAIKEFFFKEYCNRNEETRHVTIPRDDNREIVERFKVKFIKEARTIFKLNHSNIIRILDIFEENNTAYYVMDYIEGESLGDMVKRRGALPEAEAIGYIKEVGSALTYIHGRSMNHLDIKPNNLMKRNDNGKIQVIDFGVAKQYDLTTSEGTTTTPVGISHGYSPAEQYQKNGVQTFSPQSDVYALAATLFKLLTGKTPPEAMIVQDEGLSVEELRTKGVSKAVIQAIDAAMQTRRMRTQSVAEFLKRLDAQDLEAILLTPQSIKSEEDLKRKEANAKRLAEEKAKAGQKAAEEVTQTLVKEVTKRSRINKKKLGGFIITIIVVVLAGVVIYVLSFTEEPLVPPIDVESKHITLTHGAMSKRNYVYTGMVDANGVPEGQGEAKYPGTMLGPSSTYIGTFFNGIPSNGEMVFSSGMKYKGTFDKDGYFTKGTLWNEDGYYFEGTFKDGMPWNGAWYYPRGRMISTVVIGYWAPAKYRFTATLNSLENCINGLCSSSNNYTGSSQTYIFHELFYNMVYVQGGTFTMGATSEQGTDANTSEKPSHGVKINSFYVCKYEVTQELWQMVMGSNPSCYIGSRKPVERVSWNECQIFISKLNDMTGKQYRLLTEAEWEYACRGGRRSNGYKYSGSNSLGNVAWYGDNSDRTTHEVGTKSPNELGIYDMSGNVWEWCNDWYGDYSSSSQTNPDGPDRGNNRVNRGGGWGSNDEKCRSSRRNNCSPGCIDRDRGLRLCLSEL